MAGKKLERLKVTAEWKPLFSEEILKEALADKRLKNPKVNHGYRGHEFSFSNLRPAVRTTLYGEPRRYGDSWEMTRMVCSCRKERCVHMAAAFFAWEKEHGPWVLTEDQYHYQQRVIRAEQEERRRVRAERNEKLGMEPVPAVTAFADRGAAKGVMLFDVPKALEEFTTTKPAIERMKDAESCREKYGAEVRIEETREGEKEIYFRFSYQSKLEVVKVWGWLQATKLFLGSVWRDKDDPNVGVYIDPDGESERDRTAPLNEYELVSILEAWKAADRAGLQKVTDAKAEKFFQFIRKAREEGAQKEIRTVETRPEKKENVELLPRIVVSDGAPVLSFKIGTAGARKYIVKDCYSLIDAVNGGTRFVLGKSETIDFSEQTFVPDAVRLFDFLQRNRAQSYQGTYQVNLTGARLDNFYDMYQGGVCELLDKTNKIKDELVSVGHMDIRFTLTANRLADAQGNFIGVEVAGFVPVLIRGGSGKYVLDKTGLSRISPEEREVLAPFLSVSDAAGYFRFQVGTEKLQEFYYRILPGLVDNPFVEFVDNAAGEAAAYLPPDAVFTFFLDLQASVLSCRTEVAYGEKKYTLDAEAAGDRGYHDREQEERVRKVIRKWLPDYDADGHVFLRKTNDDFLYDFLTVGLAALEYYGTVRSAASFSSYRVLAEPQVTVGISVDSGGLLNIGLTSKDVSPKELVEIYNSYTKKKRFYRLKSGDFIDLTQDEQFTEIAKFLAQLDITPAEAIRSKIQLPVYRALYLDHMLEEHEQIASTRDRTYRALIRNFKTVRDAEYEAPAVVENVLRPYQTYGYKWLRTLQAAGFGGILADEMGLGKTLQMISIFQSDREEYDRVLKEAKKKKEKEVPAKLPSLVVCPASLVYNWQEEISRFAPDLSATVLAGTAGARKKALQNPGGTDVFITSYDLLKRDIPLYGEVRFSNCVLDEAQFIKNSKSAAARSVKLVKADHRFALTGTPIENRLSELWSIFDFLMPGFLYTQPEFERRFELPIAKQKDEEATAKLKAMTGPFILRRKKEDVLKDLPAKLEEVRYARLSGEQQKIYDAQVVRMKGMLSKDELGGEEKIKIFAELTRIRQICCDPSLILEDYAGESAKREACLELIRSAIEGGHRMLLFSQFVSMLELLEKDLQAEGIEYCKIVGSTPKEKRLSLVRSFNEGTVPVFLISLKAGGTGLNLTGADFVIHYDPWWNLAAQNQATDRAHRIGQKKQVTVFKLILKDTIEERIMALQDAKKDLADAILEGGSESILSLSAEELMALLG